MPAESVAQRRRVPLLHCTRPLPHHAAQPRNLPMASAFTHAAVGLALGTAFYRLDAPKRVWALGALCAVLPDADAIAFRMGIPYEHVLGHRGLSHSLVFAALLAAAVASLRPALSLTGGRLRLWCFLFVATAS